jgi:nitrate/nitrite transporter NarK
VGGTIFIRLLLGPLVDQFGSRILFALLLCFVSIPTACTGFVETARGLTILRLFIGFAGGSFVLCENWTTVMFTKEVVGTANGFVAGNIQLDIDDVQIVLHKEILTFLLHLCSPLQGGEILVLVSRN